MTKKTKKTKAVKDAIELKPDTFKAEPIAPPEESKKTPPPKPPKEKKPAERLMTEPEAKKVGYKRPSLTELVPALTSSDFKKLMEVYRIQNPRKYKLKLPALQAKLRRLR